MADTFLQWVLKPVKALKGGSSQGFGIFLGLLLVVLPFFMLLFYQVQSATLVKNIFTSLTETTQFKQRAIEVWLHERNSDMYALVEPVAFKRLFKQAVAQTDPVALEQLANQINIFETAYGYSKSSVLNPACQPIYESTQLIELSSDASALCQKAIQSKEYIISPFFQGALSNHASHFDVIIPVYDQHAGNDMPQDSVLGVLVFHVDPALALIPLINFSQSFKPGIESFVLRATSLDLEAEPLSLQDSPSRIEQANSLSAILKPYLGTSPQQGQLRTVSLEREVFVVYQAINNSPWVLVSQVDAYEAFKSFYKQLMLVFLLALAVLLLVGWALTAQLAKRTLAQQARTQLKQQQALEQGQQYFMSMYVDSPVPYQSLDESGLILDVNLAWESLFGYKKAEVVGRAYQEFISAESMPILSKNFPILLAMGMVRDVPFTIIRKDGQERKVVLQGRISVSQQTQKIRTHCSLTDQTQTLKENTQLKRNAQRTQALFDLTLRAEEMLETDLLQLGLYELESLTDSNISFVHFVNETQDEIDLVAWSNQTVKHYCTATFDQHYPVAKAGIWADCIRQRRPVLVNDYASEKHKNGLPEGHAHLERFISVPILDHRLVRMIIGVGNAKRNYDDFDVETIQLFGAELYQIVMLKRSYDALIASELRFHRLFDQAPIAYQSLDEIGQIKEVNSAWLSLFGFDEGQKEGLLDQPISQFLTESSQAKLPSVFTSFIEKRFVNNALFEIKHQKDGRVKEVEVTGRISQTENGTLRTHCMLVDVTKRNKNANALKLAAKVFESSGEGIIITDHRTNIVSVNEAFSDILGFSKEETLGNTPRMLQSGKHDKVFYEAMWRVIKLEGFWQGEVWNRHKNGQLIPEWLTITSLKDDEGRVQNYIGMFANISQLKASEAELQFMAFHDGLTHLPNRNKFITQVEYAITHLQRNQALFAVVMLDLDRFKNVNDSYGHAFGDEVLTHVAQQLLEIVRGTDMVARFGGDEFSVLIEALQHPEDAARLVNKIIEKVSQPFKLSNDKMVSIGCSAGIALSSSSEVTATELIQQADTALYLAKQQGKGGFKYFTNELTLHAQERILIEAELKLAIAQNDLRVFYQPQIDLSTGQLKGAEALVRWQHPTLGLVMPSYFIAIAEESGLIAQIGAWVLNETCRMAKVWHDQGHTQLVFAVNVSPKQLVYSHLLKLIMDTLQAHNLPAEVLELELTESALFGVGKDEAVHLLEQLRGLGVRIAIDDFGTGYSSLAYLKSLPLDVLKIDKKFVDDIPNDQKGMQIVSTIIAMAHNLSLKVLAEGVEYQEQADFLKFKGCDFYQGYLTSAAVDADTFARTFLIEVPK